VVIRPSGIETKMKTYISVTAEDKQATVEVERQITADLEKCQYLATRLLRQLWKCLMLGHISSRRGMMICNLRK